MKHDERTEAHRRMVCLGMDCLRIALGMMPVNYDLGTVERMILVRIAQRREARS